jgi:hypothetical protein
VEPEYAISIISYYIILYHTIIYELVQLRGKTSVSQSFVFVHDVFAVFAVFAVDVAVGL